MSNTGQKISKLLDNSVNLFRKYFLLLAVFPFISSVLTTIVLRFFAEGANPGHEGSFIGLLFTLGLVLLNLLFFMAVMVQAAALRENSWFNYLEALQLSGKKFIRVLISLFFLMVIFIAIMLISGLLVYLVNSLFLALNPILAIIMQFLILIFVMFLQFWIVTKSMFVGPSILFDEKGPLASIFYSFQITKGKRNLITLFSVFAVIASIIFAIQILPIMLLSALWGLFVDATFKGAGFELLLSVITSITSPLMVCILVESYFDFKERFNFTSISQLEN